MDASSAQTLAQRTAQSPRTPRWRGVTVVLASAASNQLGAGIGAQAFDAVGPAGVVAVRQAIAAAVLVPVARPPWRAMTWAQWWPTVLLAAVFATMNLTLYLAIDRVGLALAITLEFLGPLSLALIASRTRRDLFTAATAAVGVYVLVLPGPSSDLPGIMFGLVAAACWAAYIQLNRLVGRRLHGLQAPAVASVLCTLGYLPVLVSLTFDGRWDTGTALRVLAAGVLSSVVPYAADLTALRSVPPRLFSLLSSAQPALAALVGLVVLGQGLAVHEALGVALVIVANVLAVATSQYPRRSDPTGERSSGGASPSSREDR